MSAGRSDDRDRGEVVPSNELHRIGVDARNAGLVGRFLRLLTRAAADGRDVPAFGAERRDVDLRAEADADDADAVLGRGHADLRLRAKRPTRQILPEPLPKTNGPGICL